MRIERSRLLAPYTWFQHGFCSPGPNSVDPRPQDFSLQSGQESAVLTARQDACKRLDIDASHLTFVYQEHGTTILRVTAQDRGAGADPSKERLGPADGLYTDELSVPMGVLVADCLPVFVVDTHLRRAGLVHSGWRGTHGNIIAALLERWCKDGSDADDLHVWVGPGIGACCFETGEEVLEAFAERYPRWHDVVVRGASERPDSEGHNPVGTVDLKTVMRRQLQEFGVPGAHIDVSPACTKCGRGYFSYRRDGPGKGHNLAVAALQGD